MTCLQCGAPLSCTNSSIETVRCSVCETLNVHKPNAEGICVLGAASDFPCPQCRTVQLTHASVNGERVFFCEQCHGLLIHLRVFPQIVEELRSYRVNSEYAGSQVEWDRPEWNQWKRLVKCPLCDQPMDAHPYAAAGPDAMIIDSCADCCVNWLDHGELERILRAPEHQFAESVLDR